MGFSNFNQGYLAKEKVSLLGKVEIHRFRTYEDLTVYEFRAFA